MIVTYHGAGHIKLVTGDITISIAPQSKKSKLKQTRYGANVALIPLSHVDYDGVDNLSYGEKETFVIKSAGEYEVNNIFFNAFSSNVARDKENYMTSSFVFNFDGMRILYLGQIKDLLSAENKEMVDSVDIVFVPVGGENKNLNPYDAAKIATQLEPNIIIPIDYDEKTLPIFLKECAAEGTVPVEKLTIKKKDITEKESSVVLLDEL
jgi:L-ascorbate metabolism protein UlaG (beta-lactamase superfamily)